MPGATPFPEAERVEIREPYDHIVQGDIYGSTLVKAQAHNERREGQIEANEIACQAKHEADLLRAERKRAARQKALDEADKIGKKPTLRERLGL